MTAPYSHMPGAYLYKDEFDLNQSPDPIYYSGTTETDRNVGNISTFDYRSIVLPGFKLTLYIGTTEYPVDNTSGTDIKIGLHNLTSQYTEYKLFFKGTEIITP